MVAIGVCDLGPVGRLLATGFEAHGNDVAVWDAGAAVASAFVDKAAGKRFVACGSPGELAAALARPRRLVIATENGPRVDEFLGAIRAHLAAGDLVIHAGNERDEATARRAAELAGAG